MVTVPRGVSSLPESGARAGAKCAACATQGGKVMVADFVTSPNAQFARAHNAIERLCDPTHVRALPADQLRALFIDKELESSKTGPAECTTG